MPSFHSTSPLNGLYTPQRRLARAGRGLVGVLMEAARGFFSHQAPTMGAALAYYALFSLAPMLLIAIAGAGMLFGEDAARGEIFRQIAGLVGSDGASAIEGLLAQVQLQEQSGWGLALGVGLLLLGATTVFAELHASLDTVWSHRAPQDRSPWWLLLRARMLALGSVLGIAFLLMVSLLASAALAAVQARWAPWLAGGAAAAGVLNALLGVALATLLFALLLRYLPTQRVPWRQVWVGALVTSALFAVGRFFIGWYIGTTAVQSGFGAAGSLVVVLVWVYWSAQVFLFGAEITRAVAQAPNEGC